GMTKGEYLSEQLGRRFSDAAAKVAGAIEVHVARLAGAVVVSNRGGTVRRAAADHVDTVLCLEAVVEPDDRAAVVQQVCDDREQRGFLPAMLCGGGREGRTDFADQSIGEPQAAGLVEKRCHLARHAAKPGRRADDDAVVFGQLFHAFDDRVIFVGLEPAASMTSCGAVSGTRRMSQSCLAPRTPSATASAICAI